MTKYYEGGAIAAHGLRDGQRRVLHPERPTALDQRVGQPERHGEQPQLLLSLRRQPRRSAFSGITTKRFTGQYHEQGLPGGEGLAFYNARWYDSQVGVFVSADTLVPSPLAPQTLNRYAYVSGNPLRYIDPTGHMQREDEGGGGGRSKPKPPTYGVWRPPVQKTWTWPRIPVPSNWLWPNGRFNAVAYTLFEMRKNIASAKATEIRSLNHKANATSHALAGAARKTLANAEWGSMVAPNRPWDHKTKITAITKSLEPVNKTGGWQQVGGEEYRFDTWSNVHYG